MQEKINKRPLWNFFRTRKDYRLILKKLRVSLAKAPGRLWFGSDLTDARIA